MLLYKNIILINNTFILKSNLLMKCWIIIHLSRFYITQLYWDITIQILTSYRGNLYYCLLVTFEYITFKS